MEISLNTTTIKNKKFSWSSSFNITLPKNRLVSFPNLALSSYANTYIEGEPLNLIRAYEYLGVDQQTGLYTFRDFDGNTLLDSRDMVALGNTDPIAYGGLQNSFTYKSLQLEVFFSFRKQTGRNYLASLPQRPGQRGYNLPAEMTDFWTYPGQEATFQRLSMGNANALTAWNNFQSSNGIYSDASFIRLKNIQLIMVATAAATAILGHNLLLLLGRCFFSSRTKHI